MVWFQPCLQISKASHHAGCSSGKMQKKKKKSYKELRSGGKNIFRKILRSFGRGEGEGVPSKWLRGRSFSNSRGSLKESTKLRGETLQENLEGKVDSKIQVLFGQKGAKFNRTSKLRSSAE